MLEKNVKTEDLRITEHITGIKTDFTRKTESSSHEPKAVVCLLMPEKVVWASFCFLCEVILRVNWFITSFCLQVRSAQCMVSLNNVSKPVDATLCEDAGHPAPTTVQSCGYRDCPHWETAPWSQVLNTPSSIHIALHVRGIFKKYALKQGMKCC